MTQFDGRRLDTTNLAKPEADLDALQFPGIAHETGNLDLLTEPHTSILVVDTTDYTVKAAWAITPGPAADLPVRGGKIYIVVDHNHLDEKPPIFVYQVPEAASKPAATVED